MTEEHSNVFGKSKFNLKGRACPALGWVQGLPQFCRIDSVFGRGEWARQAARPLTWN
jgi:hypothetical protein